MSLNNNLVAVLLTTILSLTGCAQDSENTLLGSWKMHQIHWIAKDKTYSQETPQPGIFLFTPKSYSIMWTPTEEPRKPFQNLSKPTDQEAIEGFKSVVFNGGSYTYTATTLTSTAYIAKVPGFEGGKQYYRYSINGDILSLTMFDETYPDGTKPDWSGKYETKFVLKRVR